VRKDTIEMADEGFDFEALDEENEISAAIISQDDVILSESARYLTILADFGETEQFVIEGDSLILWAFDDERLDWKHGGQFLHLIYIVENLISKLLLRGSHFKIAFFETHREIWSGSRLLARLLLISHLQKSLKSPAGTECFTSPNSDAWIGFLQSYQPAFIGVCEGNDVTGVISKFSKVCYSSGMSIAYLSQLEILDHSVKGFYVQCRREMESNMFRSSEIAASTHCAARNQQAEFSSSNILPSHLAKNGRVLACCHACSAWLRSCRDGNSMEMEDAVTVAKIFLIHVILISRKSFSISERCCVTFSLPVTILSLIHKLNDFVGEFIAEDLHLSNAKYELDLSDIIDFSDGRLQCAIASKVLQIESANSDDLNLDPECLQIVEATWSYTASNLGSTTSVFPILFSEDSRKRTQTLIESEDVGTKVKAVENESFATECQFALKMSSSENSSIKCSLGDIPVEVDELEKNSWKFSEAMESFLWTHCKDQSASAESSSRSTSEWERKRQLRWKARQSQMYFRHLHDYAASLAGTTVLGSTYISSGDDGDSAPPTDDGSSVASEQSVDSKQSKGKQEKKKVEKKLTKKEQLLADIEAKKVKGASLKLESEWKELKLAIKKSASSIAKLKDLDDFVNRCFAANQMSLALEVILQKLSESRSAWQEDRDSKSNNMKFAILTVETVRMMLSTFSEQLKDPKLPIASEARIEVIQTLVSLGFIEPALYVAKTIMDPSDSESYTSLQEEAKDLAKTFRNKLSVGSKSIAHFQLEHMGYLLPRPVPKTKDSRITSFTPDEWQRTLLDVVDSRDSALVCAPTSSGKTFISYYCMEKVMRDTTFKDGVLVFVAPTKALINQIAAQVYGESVC
jgi:ATP-dependent RNA helicase DDX60